MTHKPLLIGLGLAATVFAAASIAVAQTSGPPAQSADQQTSETRTNAADHVTRMLEHCNRMMGRIL
jgi:hypothetical protein